MAYYVLLSTIKVVELHYCHSNLHSIAIVSQVTSCCHEFGSTLPSCCSELTIKIDINDDQLYSKTFVFNNLLPTDIRDNCASYILSLIQEPFNKASINPDNGPPPFEKYLKFHSFLFYG